MTAANALIWLPTYLWQIALHSWIAGLIFYLWVQRTGVPSGRTRRRLLVLVIVLPLLTAAVPGRGSVEFGERIAWFNSARILAIPLVGHAHVADLIIVLCGMALAITLWQELVPWHLRQPAQPETPPESLIALVKSKPGWANCQVLISPADSILLATKGVPGRPRLIVSRGAIAQLTPEELALAVAHEHAHWQDWAGPHVLFLVRLLQSYNPVALWAFREYILEVEVGCDAQAVAGGDPHPLARVLLKIYQSTDRRDVSARSLIRKRVDVLLAGGPNDAALPDSTMVAATVFLLLVLPWIV